MLKICMVNKDRFKNEKIDPRDLDPSINRECRGKIRIIF